MNRFDIQAIWNDRELARANALLDSAHQDETEAIDCQKRAWSRDSDPLGVDDSLYVRASVFRQASKHKRCEALGIIEHLRTLAHTAANDAICEELGIQPDR